MSAHEVAEHIEHAAHASEHGPAPKLGMYIGITMAMLGVLLALSAARVGAERTELIEAMVDQQNAHAKYQAQDIKHRMAILALQSALVSITANGGQQMGNQELLTIADTADRYLKEGEAAKEWVESYEPAIKAHVEGQEQFENAQLLAEIGIVAASIALLLHRKIAWFFAIALGVAAVLLLGSTFMHMRTVVHATEAKITETGAAYRAMRTGNKTTHDEEALIERVRHASKSAAPAHAPAAHPAPAAEE